MKKPTANSCLMMKRLNNFPLQSGTSQGICSYHFYTTSYQMEVLANTVSQRKEIKIDKIGEEKENCLFVTENKII